MFAGIFQNELTYDLLWDMAFRTEPIADIRAWTAQYVRRRYGLPDSGFDSLYAAYDILIATVYNCTTASWGVTKSISELTPSLQMNSSGFMPTVLWYDNAQLESAVTLTLQAADSIRTGEAVGRERYEYDVVDFTKQWMSNLLIGYHAQLVGAYSQQDNATLTAVGRTIMSLLEDWDALLNTNERFLLGCWIRDARQWGATVDEQDWLEFNARNQITLWGPDGQIADYASKVSTASSYTLVPLTAQEAEQHTHSPPSSHTLLCAARLSLDVSNGPVCSRRTTRPAGDCSLTHSPRPSNRASSGTRRRSTARSGRGSSSGSTRRRSTPPRRRATQCSTRGTSLRSTKMAGCYETVIGSGCGADFTCSTADECAGSGQQEDIGRSVTSGRRSALRAQHSTIRVHKT